MFKKIQKFQRQPRDSVFVRYSMCAPAAQHFFRGQRNNGTLRVGISSGRAQWVPLGSKMKRKESLIHTNHNSRRCRLSACAFLGVARTLQNSRHSRFLTRLNRAKYYYKIFFIIFGKEDVRENRSGAALGRSGASVDAQPDINSSNTVIKHNKSLLWIFGAFEIGNRGRMSECVCTSRAELGAAFRLVVDGDTRKFSGAHAALNSFSIELPLNFLVMEHQMMFQPSHVCTKTSIFILESSVTTFLIFTTTIGY